MIEESKKIEIAELDNDEEDDNDSFSSSYSSFSNNSDKTKNYSTVKQNNAMKRKKFGLL